MKITKVYINDDESRMVLSVQDKEIDYIVFWKEMVKQWKDYFKVGDDITVTGADGPKLDTYIQPNGQSLTVRSGSNISIKSNPNSDKADEELERMEHQYNEDDVRVNQDLIDGPDNVIEKKIAMGQAKRLEEMGMIEKDGALVLPKPLKKDKYSRNLEEQKELYAENSTDDYIDVIDKVNAQSIAQEKKRGYPAAFNKVFSSEQNTKLTEKSIKEYVSLSCPTADDKDIKFFIAFCLNQNLNPFIKDCYLVKYGNKPATIITAKESFLKRADEQDDYKGFEAGIIVTKIIDAGKQVNENPHEHVIERQGSFYTEGETLIGGWAKILREGKEAFYDSVRLDEYDTKQYLWKDKPATMIRKVALVHALREAYPKAFQGMYDKSEMSL